MPSSAHDRARSAKAWAGERKTCPETASGQDLEAVRMRVARSSEGMTAMVEVPDGGRPTHPAAARRPIAAAPTTTPAPTVTMAAEIHRAGGKPPEKAAAASEPNRATPRSSRPGRDEPSSAEQRQRQHRAGRPRLGGD